MKKILKIALIINIALLSYFIIRIILNLLAILLNSHILFHQLYLINFNEPYIAYYNEGNLYYKEKKYNKAIELYLLALQNNPPKSRICDIEENILLSQLKLINTNIDLNTVKERLSKSNCLTKNNKKLINYLNKRNISTKNKILIENNYANNNRQLDIELYENLGRYNYNNGKEE